MFLLLFGAAEVYFRIRYPRPGPPDQTLVSDPELGWDTRPFVRPLENSGTGHTVYFLGDSFTDGTLWPGEVQRVLREKGVELEGYSLGVSGYGTTQSLLKLQRYYDLHHPDIVVLLFFAWNDLRDNQRYPEVFYGPDRPSRPYLVPRLGGYSVRERSFSFLPFLRHSECYRRLILQAHLRLNAFIAHRWLDVLTRWSLPVDVHYEIPYAWSPFYFSSFQDHPYVEEAYAVTGEAFRILKKFVEKRGSKLIVIGIDNAFSVDDDVKEAYRKVLEGGDVDLPLHRLEGLLKEQSIAFINAVPALRTEQKRIDKKIYNGPPGNLSGHLEPEGEQVIGRLVADAIHSLLRP